MNPEHLLEQADGLIGRHGRRPRQADLRRAVSTAYYAVFHCVLRAAADMVVGASFRRSAPEVYTRVYRALDHADLKRLKEYRTLDPNISRFAAAAVQLREDRHDADYNPIHRVAKQSATAGVRLARSAISAFQTASDEERKACLAFLLFKGGRK